MRISDWSSDVCSSDLAVSDAGGNVIDFSWTGSGSRLRYSQSEPPAKQYDATRAEGLSGYRMDERIWTLADLTPYPLKAPERTEHLVTVDEVQPADERSIHDRAEPAAERPGRTAIWIDISPSAASQLQVRGSNGNAARSEEHTSELQSLMRIS